MNMFLTNRSPIELKLGVARRIEMESNAGDGRREVLSTKDIDIPNATGISGKFLIRLTSKLETDIDEYASKLKIFEMAAHPSPPAEHIERLNSWRGSIINSNRERLLREETMRHNAMKRFLYDHENEDIFLNSEYMKENTITNLNPQMAGGSGNGRVRPYSMGITPEQPEAGAESSGIGDKGGTDPTEPFDIDNDLLIEIDFIPDDQNNNDDVYITFNFDPTIILGKRHFYRPKSVSTHTACVETTEGNVMLKMLLHSNQQIIASANSTQGPGQDYISCSNSYHGNIDLIVTSTMPQSTYRGDISGWWRVT